MVDGLYFCYPPHGGSKILRYHFVRDNLSTGYTDLKIYSYEWLSTRPVTMGLTGTLSLKESKLAAPIEFLS